MKEECLICKAPLEYLETDVPMECEICHKKENSKTRCMHGPEHHVMVGSALLTLLKNTLELRWKRQKSFAATHLKTISASVNAARFPDPIIDTSSNLQVFVI